MLLLVNVVLSVGWVFASGGVFRRCRVPYVALYVQNKRESSLESTHPRITQQSKQAQLKRKGLPVFHTDASASVLPWQSRVADLPFRDFCS